MSAIAQSPQGAGTTRSNGSKMLFSGARGLSLSSVDSATVQRVWNTVSAFIEEQLGKGKGVAITGFGTWTLKASTRDLGNYTKTLRTPIFILSEKITHGQPLRFSRPNSAGGTPVSSLSNLIIAQRAGVSRDTVASVVKDMCMLIRDSGRTGKSCRISMQGVGDLIVYGGKVSFRFSPQWDGTFESQGRRGVKTPLFTASRPLTGLRPQSATVRSSVPNLSAHPAIDSSNIPNSRPMSAASRPSTSSSRRPSTAGSIRPSSARVSATPTQVGTNDILSVQGAAAAQTRKPMTLREREIAKKMQARREMKEYYDFQRKEKLRREELEVQADQAMLAMTAAKLSALDDKEAREKQARFEARRSIDMFNQSVRGNKHQAPLPDEFGNIFENRTEQKKVGFLTTDQIKQSLAAQIDRQRQEKEDLRQQEFDYALREMEQDAKDAEEERMNKAKAKKANQELVARTLKDQMEQQDPGMPASFGNAVCAFPREDGVGNDKEAYKMKQKQILADQFALIREKEEQNRKQREADSEWMIQQAEEDTKLAVQEKERYQAEEKRKKDESRRAWLDQMREKQLRSAQDSRLPEFGNIFRGDEDGLDDEDCKYDQE